jgi:hypothetical protein
MAEKKYVCLKCDYDHTYNNLPRGQVSSRTGEAKVCEACDGEGFIPETIMKGIERYCGQQGIVLDEVMGQLKNGQDHFYFWRNGMYHGVEYRGEHRGYLHT